MSLSGSLYSSVPNSINSYYSNHVDQHFIPNSFSPISFEGLPCLLNVKCLYSLAAGEVVVYVDDGRSEGTGGRIFTKVKGVDRFIENMGLKVVDMKGESVLL